MYFDAPDGGVLRVDRVGAPQTYAARLNRGPWTALGDLRTVLVAATGKDPEEPWITAVTQQVREAEIALQGGPLP